MPQLMRRIIFFNALILFIGLIRCSIENPKTPRFDSELSIPITAKKYEMRQLAEENDNLFADENNRFGFLLEGDLDTVNVIDLLKYDESLTDEDKFDFGLFKISASNSFDDSSLTFQSFWPAANNFNGQKVTIPSFKFNVSSGKASAQNFENFLFVEIDSGWATLSLTNDLPVPLGLPLQATLKDYQGNSNVEIDITMIDYEFSIQPGETIKKQVDLSGHTITNRLYIEIRGDSPGSSGETVPILVAQQRLMINLNLTEILAKNATARLSQLEVRKSDWLKLNDEENQIIMNEARFITAQLKLAVKSYWNLNTSFWVTVEHFFDQRNNPLGFPLYVPKNDSVSTQKNLDGWYLKADLSEGTLNPKIKIKADGLTDSTGKEMATVSFKDSLIVTATLDNVKLEYVRGIVNRLKVELDSSAQEVDLDYEIPDLKFRNTEAQLDIYNKIAFPIELNLSFLGRRQSGKEEKFEFRQKVVEPAIMIEDQFDSQENVTRFHFKDEQLDRLINIIPEEIEVSGHGFIGQFGTVGQATKNDYIYGKYSLKAPFEFALEDTIINFDTTYLQINPPDWNQPKMSGVDYELNSDLTNKILDGKFWSVTANKLPLAINAILKIDTVVSRIFSDSTCVVEKSAAIRSVLATSEGKTIRAVKDTLFFPLNAREIEIFKNDTDQPKTVVVGLRFQLAGTNGQYIQIFADDYFEIIQSYLTFRYPINEN